MASPKRTPAKSVGKSRMARPTTTTTTKPIQGPKDPRVYYPNGAKRPKLGPLAPLEYYEPTTTTTTRPIIFDPRGRTERRKQRLDPYHRPGDKRGEARERRQKAWEAEDAAMRKEIAYENKYGSNSKKKTLVKPPVAGKKNKAAKK